MGVVFVPPPGWPTPPEGWLPGPRWRPPKEWPEPPARWEFFREKTNNSFSITEEYREEEGYSGGYSLEDKLSEGLDLGIVSENFSSVPKVASLAVAASVLLFLLAIVFIYLPLQQERYADSQLTNPPPGSSSSLNPNDPRVKNCPPNTVRLDLGVCQNMQGGFANNEAVE